MFRLQRLLEFTTCATPLPAAAAVALALNVPADLIRAGLEKFQGVGRRFEVRGQYSGVTLIDDYGHHPAEIRATLEAARSCHFGTRPPSSSTHRA